MKYLTLIAFFLLASCSKEPSEPQVTLKCKFQNFESFNFEINNFLSKDNINEDYLYKERATQYIHYDGLKSFMVIEHFNPMKCIRNNTYLSKESDWSEEKTLCYSILYADNIYRDGSVEWETNEGYYLDKNTLKVERVITEFNREYNVEVESYRVKGSCSINNKEE